MLRELSPGVPVTTNFMVMHKVRDMDYFSWAPEVDLVSNDHYVTAADPEGYRELAFSADLVRGVAGGRPWLLMEQSTSAVNWQPRNVAKRPGRAAAQLRPASRPRGRRRSCSSSGGPPGPGPRSSMPGWCRTPAATAGSGARWSSSEPTLGRIQEIAGSEADNDVAILFDWQAWWGCELDSHPSEDVRYLD